MDPKERSADEEVDKMKFPSCRKLVDGRQPQLMAEPACQMCKHGIGKFDAMRTRKGKREQGKSQHGNHEK